MADQVVTEPSEGVTYRAVLVRPGPGGWGKGLVVRPTATRNKVLSVTGGGIDPVARRIAELTGAEALDGFHTTVPDNQIACVVVNCGGTARIGVYPRKKILTVDVYPGAPGGPLAQFITEDLFVSAVTPRQVEPLEGQEIPAQLGPAVAAAAADREVLAAASAGSIGAGRAVPGGGGGFARLSDGFVRFGSSIGYVVNTLLASGRQAITLTINTILPFMAYVSLLLGIVLYTGVARDLGTVLKPLATNPIGLVIIGVIVALPFLSPILGPGAAVAQIIGVLMGAEIAIGVIPVQYALPTLFAIDGQVGCDFIPVGLGLGEAQPETVAVGTPAVLFSRQITSPLAVVLAWLASFGMYAR
ncbi:MAG: PTS glucitol/sorbitol transporter subunit IIB [Candidatus Dormibacteraceae bacterium]